MEKDDIFEIFSILSKAVIVVPIVVVLIGLIYRFNQNQISKIKDQNLVTPTVISQSKINIDLKGPLICGGKIDNLTVNAFIKDKKIRAILDQKTKKENLLLNGDCYYRWQENQYTGEKVCGLSSFLNIAETLMNFDVLNLVKLGLDQKIATDQAKIAELVQSCKKQNVDARTFDVPGNILFKNKK